MGAYHFTLGCAFGKVPAVYPSVKNQRFLPAPFGKGAFGCTDDTGQISGNREEGIGNKFGGKPPIPGTGGAVTIRRRLPSEIGCGHCPPATRRSSRPSGAMGAVHKKCPLQRGLQRAGFYLDSRSLSSASSEPLARLKRPRSCSTVSLFFSSPATSTRILPSYIIIRRLP